MKHTMKRSFARRFGLKIILKCRKTSFNHVFLLIFEVNTFSLVLFLGLPEVSSELRPVVEQRPQRRHGTGRGQAGGRGRGGRGVGRPGARARGGGERAPGDQEESSRRTEDTEKDKETEKGSRLRSVRGEVT